MTQVNVPKVNIDIVTSLVGEDFPGGSGQIRPPPPPQSNLFGVGYRDANGTSFYRMDTGPWSLVTPLDSYTPKAVWSMAFNFDVKQLILGFDVDLGFDVYDTSVYPFTLITSVSGPQLGDRTVDIDFNSDGSQVVVSWDGDSSPRASIYDTSDYGGGPVWETEVGRGVQARWNFSDTRILTIGDLFAPPYLRMYDTASESIVALPTGLPSDDFETIAWHPRQNIFAGIESGMVLWLSTLSATIGSLALAGGSGNTGYDLRWNNDGTKLLYGRSGSGNQTVVLNMSDLYTPASWIGYGLSPEITGGTNSQGFAWSTVNSKTGEEYFSSGDDVEPTADKVRAYSTLSEPFTAIASFHTVNATPTSATFLSNINLP